MHFGCAALKQSPATASKQGVAAEQVPGSGQVVGDVGAGMPRHGDHLHPLTQQLKAVAIAHPLGLQRNSLQVVAAGQHRRLGPAGQQAGGAADVVAVVVGVQDRHQLQPLLLEGSDHWLCHRRIDHHRLALALQQKYVVVAQYRNQPDAELLHR